MSARPSTWLTALRKRKLVQWALAYIAGAWVVLQAMSLFAGIYGWPSPLLRITAGVLAVGLPVVLLLAWYHGERGAQRVSGAELAIMTLLLLIGGGVLWQLERPPSATPTVVAPGGTRAASNTEVESAPDTRSIAVLPFADLSPKADQRHFTDGMAEEILNALAAIPGLRVAARTSSFSFRDQEVDVRKVGKALGVASVLEGSVRKDADKVRITAQLIDARNGYHLWSQTWTRDLADIFALQEDIAKAIAGALRVEMGLLEGQALVAHRTGNLAAYERFLQGRALFHRRGPGVVRAVQLLEQAVGEDPNFAPAWAALAEALTVLPWYDETRRHENAAATWDDAHERARAAAARALALDPTLPSARNALANIDRDRWQWEKARVAYEALLAAAPEYAQGHEDYAELLISTGRIAEGLQIARRARDLDPLSGIIRSVYARALRVSGKFEEARTQYLEALELSPGLSSALDDLFNSHLQLRDFRAAAALVTAHPEHFASDRDAIVTALESLAGGPAANLPAPSAFRNAYHAAYFYNAAGDNAQTVAALAASILEPPIGEVSQLWDPAFRHLWNEPGFRAIVERAGSGPASGADSMAVEAAPDMR